MLSLSRTASAATSCLAMSAPALPHFITAAEMQVEQAPWCQCDWLNRPGLTPTENLLLVRAHMPPGEAHRFHRHPHAEELIYVLEGQAEQWVGQEKRLLGPGEMAQIPLNAVHATRNVGSQMLRFLALFATLAAACGDDGRAGNPTRGRGLANDHRLGRLSLFHRHRGPAGIRPSDQRSTRPSYDP